jgi:hypothetical protein
MRTLNAETVRRACVKADHRTVSCDDCGATDTAVALSDLPFERSNIQVAVVG